jgi:hypothetical protein
MERHAFITSQGHVWPRLSNGMELRTTWHVAPLSEAPCPKWGAKIKEPAHLIVVLLLSYLLKIDILL